MNPAVEFCGMGQNFYFQHRMSSILDKPDTEGGQGELGNCIWVCPWVSSWHVCDHR